MIILDQMHFDAIVIGTGPGGAAIARELSLRGKKVLILERGSDAPIKGTLIQCLDFNLIPGKSLFFTEEMLAVMRGIAVGGSSIPYYATAFEPPYEIFLSYGIDLKPEVEAIKQELPIAPLADRLVGPASKIIMNSARELGLDWAKLPKIMNQQRCRPNCDKCTYGCPYGAKWTSRFHIEESLLHGATLLPNAYVHSLEAEKDQIKSVNFTYKGRHQHVSAPIVILAAGGIGTPLILRTLGISEAGNDYFFDPLMIMNGSISSLEDGREFPMAAGLRNEEQGYLMSDLQWPNWVYYVFTSEAFRFDRLAAHRKTLGIMVKIKDDLGGNITAHGNVRKRLTKVDRERLIHGGNLARKILENAGAQHIFAMRLIAAHPGGTAKIGEVVDSNLRTRFKNLYICDTSVIPISWGLPPTLTVIALAKRLAKHLQ